MQEGRGPPTLFVAAPQEKQPGSNSAMMSSQSFAGSGRRLRSFLNIVIFNERGAETAFPAINHDGNQVLILAAGVTGYGSVARPWGHASRIRSVHKVSLEICQKQLHISDRRWRWHG